ncbi:hypothetical protein U9M48_003103 [Paspalum notatum var. saurae]|uniref:Uncharacterized protein n=1 Tax=Paspalum notatum var. saurae TaxID=547442 RepID=A0AAQ3SHY8_PASNO
MAPRAVPFRLPREAPASARPSPSAGAPHRRTPLCRPTPLLAAYPPARPSPVRHPLVARHPLPSAPPAGRPGPYKALCELWASEDFQERSKKHRNAGTKNASHTLGGDGYRQMAQRTEEYGKEMSRRYGEEYDWRNAPIDGQAVYDRGGGKSHGRYSMFNGMIDSRQVSRGHSSQSSSGSSSRSAAPCTT